MRQIIAAGTDIDVDNPLLDLYMLAQTNKPNPKICLIPTASGDNGGFIGMFYKVFNRYPCIVNHLSFFHPKTSDVEGFILEQDILYVSGGHSKSMLGVWKEHGFPATLSKAYDSGIVLSGGSAGSVCWFDECITDSVHGSLTVMPCLSLLPYSNCPHYTSKERRAKYNQFIASGSVKGGYAIDDGAAAHFIDEQFHRSVSIHPASKTYKLERDENRSTTKRLKTQWLGVKKYQQELIWDTPTFANVLSCEDETELQIEDDIIESVEAKS